MAKRFTETKKWDDLWFQDLSSIDKLAWLYVCDRCDEAGFIEISRRVMGAYIEDFDEDSFVEGCEGRLVHLGKSRYWIPSFITFQYKTLNPFNKAHKGLIKKIKEGLSSIELPSKVSQLLASWESTEGRQTPTGGSIDPTGKGIDIGKGKGRGKDVATGGIPLALELIYQESYPRKDKKSKGMAKLVREIQTSEDVARFAEAVKNYRKKMQDEKRETKHILTFETFAGQWEDYLDVQTSEDFSESSSDGFDPKDPKHPWNQPGAGVS